MSAGSTSAWWVTSSPAIRIGMPASNTMAAASGSAQMLNSAEAVVLPSPSEPPISEIAAIRSRRPGAARSSSATFVERTGRDQGDRLVGGAEQAAGQLERAERCRADRGLGKVRAVEPRVAVERDRDPRLADDRAFRAGGDRHVGPAQQGQHPERVAGRPVEPGVAGDRGDREQPELRPGQRQDDRQGVVVTGVAVEDDRDRGHRRQRIAAPPRGGSRPAGRRLPPDARGR